MAQDYYQILGVTQNASADEIKKAYRKMAMKHHPDRNPGDASAEAKFKDIQKAYDILSTPEKKRAYDQHGHDAFERHAQNGGGQDFGAGFGGFGFGDDISDFFSSFFGGGGRSSNPRERTRGEDMSYSMEITLEQAAKGHDAQIKIPTWNDCTDCGGTGAEKGSKIHTCSYCKGHGTINIRQGMFSMQQTCPQCQGTGKTFEKPCQTCHTTGKVKRQKTLDVNIPAGIESGMRIRSSGNGKPGANGGPNGDLYLEIHIQSHDIFERDGQDLHCRFPLSFATATLGGEVEVPTLDGKVTMTIPEGTQNGQVLRARQKGIRSLRGDNIGDLYVHISIDVPVKLNDEQKNLLREFAQSLGEDAQYQSKNKGFVDKIKDFFD